MDRSFNRQRKVINIFFFINVFIILAIIIGMIVLVYNIFVNPESVGEFFGKIVKGFKLE